MDSTTHLCPGVHGLIPPVANPSPATDTGVPLFVFGVSGGEIDGIRPPLITQLFNILEESRVPASNRTDIPHLLLCGLPFKVFIHVPVPLPLPAAGRQLEAVQRLVLQTRDVAPLPAVARQQTLGKTIDGIPALEKDKQTARQSGDIFVSITVMHFYRADETENSYVMEEESDTEKQR